MVMTECLYIVTIAEMIWVGRLGAASVAGVGVAFIVVMLIMTAQVGLSVAARAMVARFIGAGDDAGANHVALQAAIISTLYGLIMTLVGFTFAGAIMGLFRLDAAVIAEGAAYLRVFSLAWIPISFWLMTYGMIQASGDPVSPMKIELIMRSTHLILTPVLVLGWWVVPRLGVTGAALSSLVVEILGTSLALWYLLSGRTRLRLRLRGARLDPGMMWRLVRIGIPACVMNLQGSISGIVLTSLMAPFGTLAVAGHALINRIQLAVFLPTYGLSLGAGVLTGQNLGAGQPERAEKGGWLAAGLAAAFSVAFTLIVLFMAESIAGLFSSDQALIRTTSAFLRIAAAAYLVSGFGSALQQCISGAGDTAVPMAVSLLTVWGLQIPLSFLLPGVTGWGVYGVRWAMVAPAVAGAAAYAIYFRTGRWKRKNV
jgi:putative MATE family efflux protein